MHIKTPAGHPERPERLTALAAALDQSGVIERCSRIEAESALDEDLLRVHTPGYLHRLRAACADQQPMIDTADCPLCPQTEQISRLVSGAMIAAAEQIMSGQLKRAFVAARPPGHHAEADFAMGFCYTNHVAVAAKAVQHQHPGARVAIFDFDVHHGNGTQHLFEADPSVLTISTHGHPDTLYPGSGYAEETGRSAGGGATLNLPLIVNTDDQQYLELLRSRVLPAIGSFHPDLIILSAGFDAHADDPLGNLSLTDECFEQMTDAILTLAEQVCDGRVLSMLEGGYDLGVLQRCVPRHVQQLAG
jgi:acetoin utilization deacetylase AcuC-like enzyme